MQNDFFLTFTATFLPLWRIFSWFGILPQNLHLFSSLILLNPFFWSLLTTLSDSRTRFFYFDAFYSFFLLIPFTSLSLRISFICSLIISLVRHTLIAFSSLISAPFLSSASLIFSDLTPSIIMYVSKLSCNSPNSHVDAKFFSYPMYWSNVSSSF